MPSILETTDAAASTATAYQLSVGQTARGQLTTSDQDFFKIQLTAGQTYTFAMSGTGASNVKNPLLKLFASNATQYWGRTHTVNTTTTGNQQEASVAVLDGGGFVVVWTDASTALSTIKGQMYDAGGGKVGSEFAIGASQAAFHLRQPAVTAISGGGFEVAFTKQLSNADFDIFGQQFTANGTSVAPAAALHAPSNFQDFPYITRLGSGFAVAMNDDAGATNNVRVTTFNAAGVLQTNFLANTTGGFSGSQSSPAVAQLSNGNMAVAWMGIDSTIKYRMYNSSGTALTAELTSGIPVGAFHPTIVAYGEGGFTIAGESGTLFPDGGLKSSAIQTFNATGTAVAGPFLLNLPDTATDAYPYLAALPDGRLFAGWQEFNGSTNYVGRIIDPMTGVGGAPIVITADGAPGNGAFAFNNNLTLATMTDGRVVAVWADGIGVDGAGSGIRMQILDPREGLVTGAANADLLYGSDANNDAMAGLAGNDTMFGMAGNDTMFGGGGNDVLYGQTGNDLLISGANDDTTYAGVGDDQMFGEDGGDILWGEAGNDFIAGQNGADTMLGQDGNDFLFFEAGTDVGYGGTGGDQFYWNTYTQGADIVQDFNRAEGDQIWFDHTGFGMPAGWNLADGFNFFYGAGVAPTQATATVYFTTENNILWFDIDGSGAGAATAITFLVGTPALQASDIVFA